MTSAKDSDEAFKGTSDRHIRRFLAPMNRDNPSIILENDQYALFHTECKDIDPSLDRDARGLHICYASLLERTL